LFLWDQGVLDDRLIFRSGDFVKTRIQVKEEVQVPQTIKEGLQMTEKIMATTSTMSGQVVGAIVGGLTEFATSTITGVYNLCPEVSNEQAELARNLKQVLTGTVKCVGGIVIEATNGIKNVVVDATGTTCEILDAKFGQEVAAVGMNGMNIVKGGVETYLNISTLGVKGIVIATTKSTTGQLLFQGSENPRPESEAHVESVNSLKGMHVEPTEGEDNSVILCK
jgi:hypothetical protein